jgi:hypothetical protein
MNLAQALKAKNRIAGELVRQQQILQRENARRSDSVSTVNRQEVWQGIIELSEKLGTLKGMITQANVNIYPALERMAELKARIAYLNGLPKREGEEITSVGYNQEKLVYKWDSLITQQKSDELVADLQQEINDLQDEVDSYNATTEVDE